MLFTGLFSVASAQALFYTTEDHLLGIDSAHGGVEGFYPYINKQSKQLPTDMATGQYDLGSYSIETFFFQVTLAYIKLTIKTKLDTYLRLVIYLSL